MIEEPIKHRSSARFKVQPGAYAPAEHGERSPHVYYRDMEIWGFEEDVRPLLRRMRIDRCPDTGEEKMETQHVDNPSWRRRGDIERFEDGSVHVKVRFSIAVDSPTCAKNRLITSRVDSSISEYASRFRNEEMAAYVPPSQEIT